MGQVVTLNVTYPVIYSLRIGHLIECKVHIPAYTRGLALSVYACNPQGMRIPRKETVWKSEWGRTMTYAPEHEKELLHRSIRRRMGASGAPCSGSQ